MLELYSGDVAQTTRAVIRKCGTRFDPREYALYQCRMKLAENNSAYAGLWLRVAMLIDNLKKISYLT